MKKYLCIYKSELMSSMQYVLNIVFNSIGYIILIFIFLNLWNYIYEDNTQLINGYTKFQMIWYVIFTEILWGATSGRKFCKRICDDVKNGNIAYILNKPYSYISYILSSHLGETTVKAIITTIIGMSLGIIFLNGFPCISIIEIMVVIISSFLAIVINSLFIIAIGLLSFIIEDATPFYWLYSKMILVLGVLFPIEYFYGVLAKIMRYSPIYVTCYGPAKLFVDFNYSKAVNIIGMQIIYLVVALLICYIIYGKGVKKLNVNGG